MASARQSYSFPLSPSPPTDLGSYTRTMHQHTKKQMEAASQSTLRRSDSGGQSDSSSPMSNGAVPRSRGGSTEYGYRA